MSETSREPSIVVLFGDDTFSMERSAEEQVAATADPSMQQLNVLRFPGRQTNWNELVQAVQMPPFWGSNRLVLVQDAWPLIGKEEARARSLLDTLPSSTRLLLLVTDRLVRGAGGYEWEHLSQKHWLQRYAREHRSRVRLQPFLLPSARDMPGWIQHEVRAQGGRFTSPAAALLAAHVGSDTRLAFQEIEKLLTYVGKERPVEVEDVTQLTPAGGEVSIFEMVDAIATGDGAKATRDLERLLQEQEPLSLFAMIVRQYRLLLQTAEILQESGGPESVQRELHQPAFLIDRLISQARRYELPELESVYHRLLQTDIAIKRGEMAAGLALEVLIGDLTSLYSRR